jgi:hypothetical protein
VSNTYTWSIPQLEVAPHENGHDKVVKIVHWRLKATDAAGHVAEAYGTTPLAPPAAGGPFVAYDDLPQSTVHGWLESAIPADDLARLRAALDAELVKIANPPILNLSPPWAGK